jgi:hypothetical protein
MKIQLIQEKEQPEEGVELNMFTIIITPETEEDKEKLRDLMEDFYFEPYFDEQGRLQIIF